MVLDDLVEAGLAWHSDAAEQARTGARPAGEGASGAEAAPAQTVLGVRGPKRPKLREREPW